MGIVDILSHPVSPVEHIVYSWRANSPWKYLHIIADIFVPLGIGVVGGVTQDSYCTAIGKHAWLIGLDFFVAGNTYWNEGLNYTAFTNPEDLAEFAKKNASYLALATGKSDLFNRWINIRDTEADVRGLDYDLQDRLPNIVRFGGQSAVLVAASYTAGFHLGALVKRQIAEMTINGPQVIDALQNLV